MEKYESAYGIAALILIINMLQRSVKNRTITKDEVIAIIQDSSQFVKTSKALPFDQDMLDYVQASLEFARGFFVPLDVGTDKHL